MREIEVPPDFAAPVALKERRGPPESGGKRGIGNVGEEAARRHNRRVGSKDRSIPARAVLLAGGLGMRLRPYGKVLPKPLIPIGERPLLEPSSARSRPPGRPGSTCRWGATSARSSTPTSARPRPCPRTARSPRRARRARCAASRTSTARGSVTGYREKASLSYDISMGIYVYERRALDLLPPSGPFQFPELVLALVQAGEHVTPFRTDAIWYDIGTLGEYERAMQDLHDRPEQFAA